MAQKKKSNQKQRKENIMFAGIGLFVVVIVSFFLAIKFPVFTVQSIKNSATVIHGAVIMDKQTYTVSNGRTSQLAPILICNLDGQENVPVYVYWNWNGMKSTLHLSEAVTWFNEKRVGDTVDIVYKVPEWYDKPTEQYHYYIFIKGIEDNSF